jgi:predicted HTH domain antitoxin
MQIIVQLPDDIVTHPDPAREAFEALVIEGYRAETFSYYEASQMLSLSRFEFDGFLKNRNVYDYAYDENDLANDVETLRKLRSTGVLKL